MKLNKRDFLRSLGATGISAATIGSLAATLSTFQTAGAANTNGYKALVCVFLFGGMDNHDTVLPYDQDSYDRYAEIRAPLLSLYDGMAGGSTRARDRLLPLNPVNSSAFNGRQFALPEELSGIHGLFEQGRAAIVGNVGPLIQPLTVEEFWTESKPQPKRLFSHNDQQSTWMSNSPEGAQFGWGGRFGDAMIDANANATEDFTVMTTFSNDLFLTGERTAPYHLGTDGAPTITALNFLSDLQDTSEGAVAYQMLVDHFNATVSSPNSLIERDISAKMKGALETNAAFNSALENAPAITSIFPQNELGPQLQAVAQSIQARNALGATRQIYFVGLGGFDTHSSQANDLPNLHRTLDQGVSAFYQAMQDIGLDQDVTLFTASDFGRTLAINGDGTDHGWGGHHFVVGSAVEGQSIQGTMPPFDFDHEWDVGGGRLLPSVSVSQFAEPLGRWFGLNEAELMTALPNLGNFSQAEKLRILKGV